MIRRWKNVVDINPADKQARLKLLDAYINADLLVEATSLADDLRSEFPDDYYIQVCAGRVLQKKDDREAELKFWSDLNKDYPEAADPMIGIAKLAVLREDTDEANAWVDRLLSINSSNIRALLIKAKILQQEGKTNDSIDVYLTILSVDPDHYEAEVNLSSALLKEERYDELLERLKFSIERHPSQAAFKIWLFRVHSKLQNYEKALEIIDELLDLKDNKRKSEHYREKIDLLLKLCRNDEANSVCETAIKLFPKNIKLLTLYARIGQKKFNEV